MKEKRDDDYNENELSSQMKKELSPAKAIFRIVLGFLGLLIWILIGVYPTLIFSSGIQQFIGIFTFLVKNPVIFLLIAFINILFGIIEYIFVGILYWSAIHIIWSIRWFYGYGKYRKLKNSETRV